MSAVLCILPYCIENAYIMKNLRLGTVAWNKILDINTGSHLNINNFDFYYSVIRHLAKGSYNHYYNVYIGMFIYFWSYAEFWQSYRTVRMVYSCTWEHYIVKVYTGIQNTSGALDYSSPAYDPLSIEFKQYI